MCETSETEREEEREEEEEELENRNEIKIKLKMKRMPASVKYKKGICNLRARFGGAVQKGRSEAMTSD